MAPVVALAADHGLTIVEDAAQAHGATVDGRPAGSFGIGSFSFYATKNVTSGEGGLLTSSDEDTAHRFRIIRNQGMVEPYQYEAVGRNLRMTDLQAALAIPQLERLDQINAARQANADHLLSLFVRAYRSHPSRGASRTFPRVAPVHCPASPRHRPGQGSRKDASLGRRKRRVLPQAGLVLPGLPGSSEHRSRRCASGPKAAARCLSLPVHPRLVRPEFERIAAALLQALEATA
jgi:perosamine synthetase